MAIMTGLGKPDFTTLGLVQERLLPVEPMEFSIDGTADKKKSTKFKDGKLVTAGSALGSEEYVMKIGIESVNWLALQFAFGELSGNTSSIALPELRYGVVPAASPYTFVDADITTNQVLVTTIKPGASKGQKPVTRIASGPPADNEFTVTTGTGTLTFNAAQAGMAFAYRIAKTFTNLQSIGQEAVFEALSAFSFSGIAHTDEGLVKLVIDKMIKTSVASITLSDVTKLELEFDLVVEGTNRLPFKTYALF